MRRCSMSVCRSRSPTLNRASCLVRSPTSAMYLRTGPSFVRKVSYCGPLIMSVTLTGGMPRS